MTPKSELYEKMAEVVEAVEDVEDVRVERAQITEKMTEPLSDPLASMFGLGGEPKTRDVILLVAEPVENPEADRVDFEDGLSDDATRITFEDAEENIEPET